MQLERRSIEIIMDSIDSLLYSRFVLCETYLFIWHYNKGKNYLLFAIFVSKVSIDKYEHSVIANCPIAADF